MANKILCVLSALTPGVGGSARKLQTETYTFAEGKETLESSGAQTNEAPVRMLLRLAKQDGKPVDEILCLCSKECGKDVPIELDGQPFTDKKGKNYNTQKFFNSRLYPDLKVDGAENAKITPIEFDETDFNKSLKKALEQLNRDDVIHVDTTGGFRTAANLITLSMQLMEYKQVKLGHVVYSNRSNHQIEEQKEIYGLTDLLNAVDAFTSYGQADKLRQYFAGSESPQMGELCQVMESFSEQMALCRVERLADTVRNILSKMDQAAEAAMETSGELLFQQLIPTIRENFVQMPNEKNAEKRDARLTLDLIRWCAERGMIQLAVTLYRERYARCAAALGLICPREAVLAAARRTARIYQDPYERAFTSLIKREYLTEEEGGGDINEKSFSRVTETEQERKAREQAFSITLSKDDFCEILLRYFYLYKCRNLMNHISDAREFEDRNDPSVVSSEGIRAMLRTRSMPEDVRELKLEKLKVVLLEAVSLTVNAYERRQGGQ